MKPMDFSSVRMRKEGNRTWIDAEVVQLTRPDDRSVIIQLAKMDGMPALAGEDVQVQLALGGCFKARLEKVSGDTLHLLVVEHLDPTLCEDDKT